MGPVLATVNGDKATRIAVLLSLGVWDSLPPADRRDFCETGVVLDTPGGRRLFKILKATQANEAQP